MRVAQCVIPDSKLAETLLEEQLMKFGRSTWMESRKKQTKSTSENNMQANSSSGTWECGEWYVVYLCKYNAATDTYYDCVQSEPICAYYVYVEGEGSGGGGGGGDGFPSDDPGECDPTEPCFDDGGGGGGVPPPPPPDPCETSNPPDYCSEPNLCIGNPLPNPEITPSNAWNTQGGMYGWTRSGGNQFRDGIDLSAEVNTSIYSMHSGTVVGRRNSLDPGEFDEDRTWGNYVIIESVLNGEVIRLRYAHMNNVSVTMGATIYAGQKIGLTGNTGNAQSTENIVVLPHVHVQARKVVNGQQSEVNPNDCMATKFNSDGTINTSASSCY